MVLLLGSNFAYTTALSAAEQCYCRIPGGCKVSASFRTDIATKPTLTDPSITCKPTSEVQPGPAASMMAGKWVQLNVLPGKLSITPGLYAATSWGSLRIRNWKQNRWGGQVSSQSHHWDSLCRAWTGQKVATGFLVLGTIYPLGSRGDPERPMAAQTGLAEPFLEGAKV